MIICSGSQSCVIQEEENAGRGVGWLDQAPGVTVGALTVRDRNNRSIIDVWRTDSPGLVWMMGSGPPLLHQTCSKIPTAVFLSRFQTDPFVGPP